MNLYSYGRNNPLVNIDPSGMDCIHINNDTGNYEGFERGDCDNSTEDKANTGHYIDGTVTSLGYNKATGNYSFQYNPYDQGANTPTIGSGIIAGGQPGASQALPLSISADALSWSINQTTPVSGPWHYGNWAGPGGTGLPINNADAGALQHDYCYSQGGFSPTSNVGAHNSALQACNQALCDTENAVKSGLESQARSTGADNLYEGLSSSNFGQYMAADNIVKYFTVVPFHGNGCRQGVRR